METKKKLNQPKPIILRIYYDRSNRLSRIIDLTSLTSFHQHTSFSLSTDFIHDILFYHIMSTHFAYHVPAYDEQKCTGGWFKPKKEAYSISQAKQSGKYKFSPNLIAKTNLTDKEDDSDMEGLIIGEDGYERDGFCCLR